MQFPSKPPIQQFAPDHKPNRCVIPEETRFAMSPGTHTETGRLLLDFRKDFGVSEEVVFLLADFNGIAAPTREQNAVA